MTKLGGVIEVKKNGSCCAPAASMAERPAVSSSWTPLNQASREVILAGMRPLPGGEFLMGSNNPEGFPQDGEGPVRSVLLDPFSIDIHPVTNEAFADFVADSGYITEAERFGWSFVFWSHIPMRRHRGGARWVGPGGMLPRARVRTSTDDSITQSSMLRGMTPIPSVNGRANVFRPKRSGSLRQEVDSLRRSIRGATS
jgi:formylglycine-generating enzyme required for sulfatase activity